MTLMQGLNVPGGEKMEADGADIGSNMEETEPTGGEITVTTINTHYVKGPITVTSFQQ